MRTLKTSLTIWAFVGIFTALILASALLTAAVYTQLSDRAMPAIIAQS